MAAGPSPAPAPPDALPATGHGAARTVLLGLTGVVWLLAGLYDREPWKADEAYTIGIVHGIVAHGQWLIPTLAGEPFMEKPPLVYWLAALCVQWLSPPLPMHVAARGANVLCAIAAFVLVDRAAREAIGPSSARRAVLMLALCPAFLSSSRYLTADLGLMPAAAMVCWGLIRLGAQAPHAGPMLGTGAAIGLMAKGVLLPGVAALGTMALIALTPALWRRRTLSTLGVALGTFALLGSAWPAWVGLRSPTLLMDWLWDNNVGRFFGTNTLGPTQSTLQTLALAAAMLLPAWPLALRRCIQYRQRWQGHPLLGPALFAVAWLLVLSASATSRGSYALPVLVPLCLLAAASRPPGAADAPPTSGRVRRLWLGALAIALAASAATALWGGLSRWLPATADALPVMTGLALATAALCVGWIGWVRRAPAHGAPPDGMLAAAVSLTLLFAAALAAGLPSADRRTGFREAFITLAPVLRETEGCVASLELGESERGMLDYYVDLRTRRIGVDPDADECRLRFEQQRRAADAELFGCPGMRVLWQRQRTGHPDETFRLCGPER
ncbi:MAG: glycosyltransferase family 39 protein [Burkholderiaceae bacterium]